MVMSTLHYLVILVGIALAVSFYTLFERKILGLAHIRKGPELVGAWGMLQPFADAIKLLTKEWSPPAKSNYFIYMWCPSLMLAISFGVWGVLPYISLVFSFNYLLMVFFVLTSVSVYAHLGSGWSSNSNYAMIGGLRCITQSLSYEVTMGFIVMVVVVMLSTVNLAEFCELMSSFSLLGVTAPVVGLWWMCSLAETNRSPFDFGEGESELVSGFNVEYGSGWFTLMFLGEYASMIFMSCFLCVMFGSGELISPWSFILISLVMYLYVWVRVAYPRTRYDKLMYLCWFCILPGSLFYIIWCIGVSS